MIGGVPEVLADWAKALVAQLEASTVQVEREIAGLIIAMHADLPLDARQQFIFERLHRKIDVAHRVMVEYDDEYRQAASDRIISRNGYLGLAWMFTVAALRENCRGAQPWAARARLMRWVNSGFNCLDAAGGAADQVEGCLLNLMRDLPRGAGAACSR